MYAEQKLKNAIVELLGDKPLGEITVTLVCEKSRVSRPTFYHHFDSLADLALRATIESKPFGFSALTTWEEWAAFLNSLLLHIKDHPVYYKNLLTSSSVTAASGHLTKLADAYIDKQIPEDKILTDGDKSLMMRTISGIYISAICEYIRGDFIADPDSLTTLCESLLDDAINRTLPKLYK